MYRCTFCVVLVKLVVVFFSVHIVILCVKFRVPTTLLLTNSLSMLVSILPNFIYHNLDPKQVENQGANLELDPLTCVLFQIRASLPDDPCCCSFRPTPAPTPSPVPPTPSPNQPTPLPTPLPTPCTYFCFSVLWSLSQS